MPPPAPGRLDSVKTLQEQLRGEIGLQDERCTSLSERVRDAELAMAAARAAAKAAELSHAHLAKELSTAQRLRTRLLRELANVPKVDVVPAEIWQAIFVAVVGSYPISTPFCNAVYDKNRTKAPFWLAAVCRRWREVALHTSELWTYVALPPYAHVRAANVKAKLAYLLELSKPRPIDVLFPFANDYAAFWAWEHAMASIIEEFPRWRRARIYVPYDRDSNKLSFLQRDAPHLEEAYIGWTGIDVHGEQLSVAPTALTASRGLRALHVPASFIAPHVSFPAISSLGIVVDVAESLALKMIGQMPTVRELQITPSELQHDGPPLGAADQLCLSRLHSLTLSGSSNSVYSLLSALHAPNLRHLVLKAGMRNGMTDDIINLLRVKFPAVETLEFDGPIDGAESWTISVVLRVSLLAFPGLRHLTLANCSFGALCVFDTVVWPALETITLRGRTSYTQHDYLDMTTFLGLAAWCAETEADRAGDGPPHRANFRLYVRDLSPVPAWLPRHLGRIVGPENTHVFGRDGREIAVEADDDASFTESEDSATSSSDGSESDWSDASDDPLLTVNGPDWASDVSEADPSWESEGSSADDDSDGEEDSDGDASDSVDDDSDPGYSYAPQPMRVRLDLPASLYM